ncbi:MAG: RNA 3'-terminal phosphate cyclase [Pseudomonadota bacterium]
MIVIDGSKGEGGGQVLRTALSLSACTGQPFKIRNIRGGRKKPGLLRQHLTCIKATAEICGGKVTGAELGSGEVTFIPGDIRYGDYRFDIGTAGSTGLVFQTVLPILLQADRPSSVRFGGGTHNKASPPFEFIAETFLPVIRKMGADIKADLLLRGFYPAGGGIWEVFIQPLEEPTAVTLTDRGALRSITAEAATANLPGSIAERELETVAKEMDLPETNLHQRNYESCGPGNIVLLRVASEQHTEVFAGFGEHGVSAERVARRATNATREYLKSDACISEHLADQLLLPLASFANGRFTTTNISQHFLTNKDVIEQFLDLEIAVNPEHQGLHEIEILR